MAAPGSYVLILTIAEPTAIEVGALGTIEFDAGGYAYAGSAFGSGGLRRVERHRSLAVGDRTVQHWHIDYLLTHEQTTLYETVQYPHRDLECVLSERLPGHRVAQFGASDCHCDSHLVWNEDVQSLSSGAIELIEK